MVRGEEDSSSLYHRLLNTGNRKQLDGKIPMLTVNEPSPERRGKVLEMLGNWVEWGCQEEVSWMEKERTMRRGMKGVKWKTRRDNETACCLCGRLRMICGAL
jgi:hypothetical protein